MVLVSLRLYLCISTAIEGLLRHRRMRWKYQANSQGCIKAAHTLHRLHYLRKPGRTTKSTAASSGLFSSNRCPTRSPSTRLLPPTPLLQTASPPTSPTVPPSAALFSSAQMESDRSSLLSFWALRQLHAIWAVGSYTAKRHSRRESIRPFWELWPKERLSSLTPLAPARES